MTDSPDDPSSDDALRRALLRLLAETDALTPRATTARELHGRLANVAADEPGVERCLRAMAADGLVDAFHEPYIPSRYQITRKGREA